ncbi:hypothetical protein Agub_g9777 [Astrephomene gubernaculifera]|uniref:SGNH hydrolase-type esterase domain-containing protein n=1 Tax=Astrephomene gubernaculifera TaxID=47775 RepID=A0AAD3DU11_9CHLO|nr:hypothetical protein Agub_g9777 [Astrephomene gubernaculifera]
MAPARLKSLAGCLLVLVTASLTSALEGEWLGNDFFERTRVRPELDWDWGRTWSSMSINNQPVTSILSTVLGTYKFTLPRLQLQRGLAYVGSATRLRRVVRQLMSRNPTKPTKIGVIGGSVSWGQGTRKRGEDDWFSVLSKWLLDAFPESNITTRNGCTPGVPASYMILCLELSVDPDVDLVFVEFTLNNGFEDSLAENTIVKDMERLTRRVLALPGQPAVVLMHVPTHHMASYPRGHPKNTKNEDWHPFHWTTEDAVGAMSQYYDVQALSLRTAMYDLAVRQEREGFLWEHAFVDHHPGNQGHKFMADLAVWMLQQTALGLLQLPYGQEDAEAAGAPLAGPMYPGNLPPNSSMCLLGDSFRSLVVSEASSGFDYVNEGTPEKPKPGYVATQPGSVLRFRIDTDRTALGAQPQDLVFVVFHYLRSYVHMGIAEFSCVSGCNCSSRRVDGHHAPHVSQLYMAPLEVSQSRQCEIQATVLPETSSGEHKFKVAGLVISESAGNKGIMVNLAQGAGDYGVREHNGDVVQITFTKEGRKGGHDTGRRQRR